MSDLIRREDVVEALYQAIRTTLPGTFADSMSLAIAMANNLPSVEPERMAKVVNKEIDYRDDEYEHDHLGGQFQKGKCGICKHRVIEEFDFCPNCGTKLNWSGNE